MLRGRNDTTPSRRRRPGRLFQGERRRLIDEAFQRYLDWRSESATVDFAYRHWLSAPKADCAFAYAAYKAALEREERAAQQYQTLVHAAERLVVPPLVPRQA